MNNCLPKEIGNLQKLDYLLVFLYIFNIPRRVVIIVLRSVRKNQITGGIPSEIGNLSKLSIL